MFDEARPISVVSLDLDPTVGSQKIQSCQTVVNPRLQSSSVLSRKNKSNPAVISNISAQNEIAKYFAAPQENILISPIVLHTTLISAALISSTIPGNIYTRRNCQGEVWDLKLFMFVIQFRGQSQLTSRICLFLPIVSLSPPDVLLYSTPPLSLLPRIRTCNQ